MTNPVDPTVSTTESAPFRSPFKSWLDSQSPEESRNLHGAQVTRTNLNYYELLSGLSSFVSAVRQYKYQSGDIHLRDIVEYYDLMTGSGEKLANNLKVETGQNTGQPVVELMTAHKSKGLEFDHVFVLNFDMHSWFTARGYNNKLKFPKIYQLEAERDDTDDKLRLLYVALTRAKKNLYLLKFKIDAQGKPTEEIPFVDVQFEPVLELSSDNRGHIQQIYNRVNHLLPITLSQKDFFGPILKDYKMSITHLNNYLDVTRGGPGHFFEVNLIRFPSSKHKSASFGTSMHEAIRYYYQYYKDNHQPATLEAVLEQFAASLKQQGLNKKDYEDSLIQGQKALPVYYSQFQDKLSSNYKLEEDFKYQDVRLGDAIITGKIDKMEYDIQGNIIVTDFKTGKAKTKWENPQDNDKIKMSAYARQLEFYKLLVQNSKYNFGRIVTLGRLEFLEPLESKSRTIPGAIATLEMDLTIQEPIDRLEKLIQIVWAKIQRLEFPDTSNYSQDYAGIQQFTEDLLSGKV